MIYGVLYAQFIDKESSSTRPRRNNFDLRIKTYQVDLSETKPLYRMVTLLNLLYANLYACNLAWVWYEICYQKILKF